VVLIVMMRVFAGCARPGTAVYQSAWDGEANQWEVPPARLVTAEDASGGGLLGPGLGGGIGGGGVGDLPTCTKMGQVNCCYGNQSGQPQGTPDCGWQRLVPSAAVAITALYKDDMKVTAPVALTLTSVSPLQFLTLDECMNAPVGFIVSGPGVQEGLLGSTIRHYTLLSDGTWKSEGGGGTIGLVAGRDTQATGDGGMAMPKYTLDEGLCKLLMSAGATAAITFFDGITLQIGGESYEARFNTNPNGPAKGFYAVIQKGF
jgi:hypothetical protein